MTATDVRNQLQALANPRRAEAMRRFYRTGPGGYGEGDDFLGLTVPQVRSVVKTFRALPLPEVAALLRSPLHEVRLTALLIMVHQFPKGERGAIYDLYVGSIEQVNHWDLVDASAPGIAGAWLFDRTRKPLHTLAGSGSLWERRIAIVATLHFIRRDDFADTLAIATRLLPDRHDLIHKATGWMLREVGKRSPETLTAYLAAHYAALPRTTLRYAIERFPPETRRAWLAGPVVESLGPP